MAHQVIIENGVKEDVPAIAALFTESFKDSVLHHCGKLPRPAAMEDVFSLVYQAEPKAAFVARLDGKLIGYCFAPVKLSRLWMLAITGGHILKWAWRWLTGCYGFGVHPVKVIVMNKLAFLGSAVKPEKAADARILSIAVAAECRGRRVATLLMEAALDYFKDHSAARIRLEVRPDNIPAIKVYEKLGFVQTGVTRDSQGDWLIMFKEMEQDHV